MASLFADHLSKRVLVLDGAMGTQIYDRDLDLERDYCGCENCTDILVKTRPDVIQDIHESFLKAGADCVETDSFGSNKLVLSEFDLQDETFELAKKAAEVARAACDAHSTSDKPRFALGSMGPGTKLISLGQTEWDILLDSYREQARGMIDGGVDAFLIETCQDLLQVKCCINACLQALDEKGKATDDVPICVSVTIEQMGTMLTGSSIEAAAHVLRGYPILSLGLNCATGPVEMAEHIHWLGKHWPGHVSVYPNAGLPVLVEGRTEYPLTAGPMAEAVERFIENDGVGLIGGCCGTTPEHIGALAELADGRAAPKRETAPLKRSSTSLYGPVEHRQENTFQIVGERCNASGSRKFKRLLEAEDWDSIISMAKQQVREGSHVLDVNVDYAGRDNAEDMKEIVRRLVRQVDAPLMLDSTQVKTLEAGLECAAGRCILNSANFEDGEEKFDEICRLISTFNAGLVIGTIDEDKEAAMARTADRKFAIADRGIKRASEKHGMAVADIFIDPLVLPISTGMDADRRSALELVEGCKKIAAAYPDVQITCGLSNVSFGLKPAARQVLNSVFLHELTEAGLTSAIVHASKILPLNKIEDDHKRVAMHLIYDMRSADNGGTGLPSEQADERLRDDSETFPADYDPLQAFIALFKDVDSVGGPAKAKKDMTIEERLRSHIIDGEKEGLHACLDEAMGKFAPLDIINDHLLDGMKTVGELFGSGQMQLPFVLQSAEVMKMAVAHLEPHLERVDGETKGTIVLATVKGDVHDIGKNLVDIILSNNGYTVHNIGIKQPLSNIVEAYKETKADAIGLSGLLVKSVNVMEDNLRECSEMGIDVPIILGGAALTRKYAEGYLRGVYEGPLYYGRDAFEGLRVMDMIATGKETELNAEIDERLAKRAAADEKIKEAEAPAEAPAGVEPKPGSGDGAGDTVGAAAAVAEAGGGGAAVAEKVRSDVATDVEVPAPPFWGHRLVENIKLDDVYPFINLTALFKGQWQFKKGKMSDADFQAQLEDEVEPKFESLKAWCRDEGILTPSVVYGYYPVQADGDDLVVFDPDDHDREIERFSFPRQTKRKKLCISDFFRSVDSGEKDVLAMHCVTVGQRVSEEAKKLFDSNSYSEYLYLHGIGVETAEALAEMWHKRIRMELGIGGEDSPRIKDLFTQKYRGSRYSFGYPACPEMSDQEKLFRLLEPQRIGCELTDNWQIDPEQSTSAIVVHHPEAKYFNV